MPLPAFLNGGALPLGNVLFLTRAHVSGVSGLLSLDIEIASFNSLDSQMPTPGFLRQLDGFFNQGPPVQELQIGQDNGNNHSSRTFRSAPAGAGGARPWTLTMPVCRAFSYEARKGFFLRFSLIPWMAGVGGVHPPVGASVSRTAFIQDSPMNPNNCTSGAVVAINELETPEFVNSWDVYRDNYGAGLNTIFSCVKHSSLACSLGCRVLTVADEISGNNPGLHRQLAFSISLPNQPGTAAGRAPNAAREDLNWTATYGLGAGAARNLKEVHWFECSPELLPLLDLDNLKRIVGPAGPVNILEDNLRDISRPNWEFGDGNTPPLEAVIAVHA